MVSDPPPMLLTVYVPDVTIAFVLGGSFRTVSENAFVSLEAPMVSVAVRVTAASPDA